MSQESVISRFVAEFNAGNLNVIKEILSDQFYSYVPQSGEERAAEMFHSMAVDLKAACPDLTLTIDDLEPDGEVMKARMELTGTYSNGLWGAPPTNERVTWQDMVWIRFIGDRIAVSWEDPDFPTKLALLRQFLLVPPPDQMDQPVPYPTDPPEFLLKVVMTGQVAEKPCSHIDQIKFIEPTTNVCEKCVESGDIWPALRQCLVCGFVGCCDTSKNTHMKEHYEETGHSIFRSIRLDEGWIWCYEDDAFLSSKHLNR